MSFWDKIFVKRDSGQRVVTRIGGDTSISWAVTGSASPLTPTEALELSAVTAAVRVISESIASTPLNIYERYQVNGLDMKRPAKHSAVDLFKNPNAYQTPIDFFQSLLVNALLGKGALAIKVIVNGQVKELLPVPHGGWTMEVLDDSRMQFRVTLAEGFTRAFNQDEVFYFHSGLSLDGYTSVSALSAARRQMGLLSALENQQLAISQNGGRPSGVLSFDESLPEEKMADIRQAWAQAYGASGKGGIAVLDNSAKFSPIMQSAADSQFIENRKFQIFEIARLFKLDPAFLGEGKVDAQAMRYLVTHTLRPFFVRIEQAIHKQILNNDEKLFADFDEMDLLRGDWIGMSSFYDSALGRGGQPAFLAINEIREQLGYDPLPDSYATKPLMGGYEGSRATSNDNQE
ncbi:phage portal protein [Ketogulonicigenium vulgare]|uniref:phage portal protein n=1 Tax=Ketogulonicigenium vulgare TaxID=92945 RepID=UPI00235818D0|nr:phage portal protein [Ketogulonicigenium vulgare]